MREAQERTPNARKQRPARPPVTSRPHIRASLKSRGRARAAGTTRGLPTARPQRPPDLPAGQPGNVRPAVSVPPETSSGSAANSVTANGRGPAERRREEKTRNGAPTPPPPTRTYIHKGGVYSPYPTAPH